MKFTLLTIFGFYLLNSYTLASESIFITDDFIEELKNDKSLSWTPGRVFDEKQDFANYFGKSQCSEEDIESIPVLEDSREVEEDLKKLPKFFDARKKWKYCPSIRQIRDQANCKAYWAMSVASVLSDRYCIASKGKVKQELSAQNLLSCCEECGNCQKGGCICSSWRYAATHGLVTGGGYASHKGCYPYEFRPCGGPHQPSCSEDPTPSKCESHACKNPNYNVPFNKDLHKAELSYRLPNSTLAIKKELLRHGPITALFKIYKDFLTYKRGIYRRGACKKEVGETTVKILGWGTHKTVGEYWILAMIYLDGDTYNYY
ncbi:cathepsin B-like cysteine proteinase 4 [Nilaparvata lugens]|uniref:cathepsin B-like cysteine proteinase 4 n=1 Tax=Nilaparvata lugens TaxID=108931 RepID=UPI00193CEC01|nr:cathepsin B-like cysteine proteinase 4 [Nilaparvata lugens]